jgi:hypothetical protein
MLSQILSQTHNHNTTIMHPFTLIALLLWLLIAPSSALWDEDMFPRDPRNLFFSGRARNNVPELERGTELTFDLEAGKWSEYVLKGGAGTQECFCITDCTTGDVELFLHASRGYEKEESFDWDCDDTNALSENAESCRIQPGKAFDCYAVLYGSTAATDCGVTCNFLTPP